MKLVALTENNFAPYVFSSKEEELAALKRRIGAIAIQEKNLKKRIREFHPLIRNKMKWFSVDAKPQELSNYVLVDTLRNDYMLKTEDPKIIKQAKQLFGRNAHLTHLLQRTKSKIRQLEKDLFAKSMHAEKLTTPQITVKEQNIPKEFVLKIRKNGNKVVVKNPYFRSPHGRYVGRPEHFDWSQKNLKCKKLYVLISNLFKRNGLGPLTTMYASGHDKIRFLLVNDTKNAFWWDSDHNEICVNGHTRLANNFSDWSQQTLDGMIQGWLQGWLQ